MPDLWHVVTRFTRLFESDPESKRKEFSLGFRRVLEVCGLRAARGVTLDELEDRIVRGQVRDFSELYPLLEYADGPTWESRSGSYLPDPKALAKAQKCFDRAKGEAPVQQDELDLGPSEEWAAFDSLGKAALYLYCRNHEQAIQVLTPEDKGSVIRSFLTQIHRASLDVAETGEFQRLSEGMRIPSDQWPPSGATPFGLLQRLTKDLESQGRSFLVADPEAWWQANESHLPDLPE
jgi:hypothetical protein